MARRVLICLAEGFEDIEAVAPIDVLTRCGFEVTVASLAPGPVRAAYGLTLVPTTTIDNAHGLYDAIVFPGGRKNAQALAGDERVVRLAREHYRAGKLVAAICAAPSHVLGEAAGILKGKRSSGDPSFDDKLAESGAIVTGENVTMDGNIITAMGPGAAMPFALAIADYLGASSAVEGFRKKWRI
ncbi:MAG: DJ-1 family glyoxalase III [Candidatus Zixiibacteriota bacterium]